MGKFMFLLLVITIIGSTFGLYCKNCLVIDSCPNKEFQVLPSKGTCQFAQDACKVLGMDWRQLTIQDELEYHQVAAKLGDLMNSDACWTSGTRKNNSWVWASLENQPINPFLMKLLNFRPNLNQNHLYLSPGGLHGIVLEGASDYECGNTIKYIVCEKC